MSESSITVALPIFNIMPFSLHGKAAVALEQWFEHISLQSTEVLNAFRVIDNLVCSASQPWWDSEISWSQLKRPRCGSLQSTYAFVQKNRRFQEFKSKCSQRKITHSFPSLHRKCLGELFLSCLVVPSAKEYFSHCNMVLFSDTSPNLSIWVTQWRAL